MSTEAALSPVEVVGKALEEYASRGVFRGYSPGAVKNGKATYKMMWHRDCMFELIFDTKKDTLRMPEVLPDVPSDSDMYKAFKAYLKTRQSDELPEHRRIDTAIAEIKPFNRGGTVSLTLTIKTGDYDYGVRKLIHFVHEVYMDFLFDGLYYDYMVETFDLDPDHP